MVIESKFGKYDDNLARFVRATGLVDSDNAFIRKTANDLTKDCRTALQALQALHSFVAYLPQGFDREDSKASFILKKGRGQCNTKTTLFIALARVVLIPARVHAWRVKKVVHRMNIPWLVYIFTPRTTLFTYPEVFYDGRWQLLSEVLTKKEHPSWGVCPFDDGANRRFPLQEEWIAQDLGSHWHPDKVYTMYGTNAAGWRSLFLPLAQALLNR